MKKHKKDFREENNFRAEQNAAAERETAEQQEPQKELSTHDEEKNSLREQDNLDTEFEILKKQLAESKDSYLRLYAEMENLRKRTALDIEKASKYSLTSFALKLLPVADNLERALSFVPTSSEEEKNSQFCVSLRTGVELTYKELMNAFKAFNIERMECVGKSFDPNSQKAIQEAEKEGVPAGQVIQEVQAGYMIGKDRVLREAMVIVSK